MKNSFFILCMLLLGVFSIQGQKKSASLLSSQLLEATFFVGTDGLGNL